MKKIVKSQESQCGDKQQYNSKPEAEDVVKAQMRRLNNRTARLNVYHCVYCQYWHIGNKPKELTTGSTLRKTERQSYNDKQLTKYPQQLLILGDKI